MGRTPSIFDKTPQEHAEDYSKCLEKERETFIWPPTMSIPPGHVKLQFYAYRYRVRAGLRPDMEAVVPLEGFGDLSLYSVRKLWGLETCLVIDPLDLKLGFPADPNWLSAKTVNELVAKHGCIKLIEPYASSETLMKRELRHMALSCAFIMRSWLSLAEGGVRKDVRALHFLATRQFQLFGSTFDIDWARTANLVVFLLTVLLIVGSTMGIVDVQSAWMRSLLLAGLGMLFFAASEAYVKSTAGEDENQRVHVAITLSQ